ncbi:MAG: uncharacterized protein KVP18_002468 [Porospora cf. gigantea A]|nr:MAG: hypothetical protein KVP18_002468 [Porospora cf. gigantea A]
MLSFTILFALSYGSVLEDAAIKGVNLVAEVESEIHRLLDGGDATTEVPVLFEETTDLRTVEETSTVEESLETAPVSQTVAEMSEAETTVMVSQSTATVAEMMTEATTTNTAEETVTLSSSSPLSESANQSVSALTVSLSATPVASKSAEALQSSEATYEETTTEEGGFLASTRKRNSATRFGGVLASIAVALL